ncbi:hypothetical protein OZX62_04090 [Bifidobacterium sp. ESL0690]|uniref:hypothetical protein n=1 Tax=Bifidobacterium sp. ESL0690 TaxID=2983214 RepID=UPI0023F90782|nr:hypothetical protein [Bifidobacterium sp. ESL0690]WEV47455.1 hypothetical protein OZX62_04090 [Bifidobacterium sp. ESL0690]
MSAIVQNSRAYEDFGICRFSRFAPLSVLAFFTACVSCLRLNHQAQPKKASRQTLSAAPPVNAKYPENSTGETHTHQSSESPNAQSSEILSAFVSGASGTLVTVLPVPVAVVLAMFAAWAAADSGMEFVK